MGSNIEHLRQYARKLIAQRNQQLGIERFGLVALQQLDDVGKIHAVQLDVLRLPNQLRQSARRIRQHAHGDRQQVMLLHIAQRDKAVEPCVGGFLHHLLIAAALYARQQRVALADFRLRKQLPAERLKPLGGNDRAALAGLFIDAKSACAILHALDERHACGNGEIFELGLVHDGNLPVFCPLSQPSADSSPKGRAKDIVLCSFFQQPPCLPLRGRCPS